jgi:molybdenum cofactor cytidylyltransferase
MGHSLAHGVAEAREAGGWVVALADMPRVRPSTIAAIAAAISEGAVVAAPSYREERGHPVGFAAVLRGELLGLSGDSGARALLERHRDEIRLLDCDDPGVVLDVDARADLDRLA